MNSLLDSAARWFDSIGLHPVLGGFIAGILFSLIVFRSRRRQSELSCSLPSSVGSTSPRLQQPGASNRTAGFNPEEISIPPEVFSEALELVQAGNMIEAIKTIRAATGIGLAEAKAVAEAMKKTDS